MADAPTVNIASSKGRLGILTPGMGAVSTTFIAGVLAHCHRWARFALANGPTTGCL